LIGAAWLPLGVHAVDRWVRLGRRWGLVELTFVLSMQTLGGDPQAAYLLGVASIGYALGLAWGRARSRRMKTAKSRSRPSRLWLSLTLGLIALFVWCVVSLALAKWLPTLRGPGKRPPPLRWMPWVPLGVSVAWGLVAAGFVLYWQRRGWRSPLWVMSLGLAGSATLAAALTAAQVLPCIEFTQRTGRASARPDEVYQFTVVPWRLVELAWPNILGTAFERNDYWGDAITIPGVPPKAWVPSLYLGGLTIALALSSLTIVHGPPWRVWLSVIAALSLLGSLGQFTSPIFITRTLAAASTSTTLRNWLPDLGPVDPFDFQTIRLDGYLRDSDGSFYWWLATILPSLRGQNDRNREDLRRTVDRDPGRVGSGGLRAGAHPRVVSRFKNYLVIRPVRGWRRLPGNDPQSGASRDCIGNGTLPHNHRPTTTFLGGIGGGDSDDNGSGGGQRALCLDGSSIRV
jgi:hypothetical protein